MEKHIITFFLMALLIFGSAAYAQPTVGVILDGPSIITNDESKMQELDMKLLEFLPSEKCKLLPSNDMTNKTIFYRTANNMMMGNEPDMEKPLSNAVLSALGKQDGCDYVLVLRMKQVGKGVGNNNYTKYSNTKDMVVMALTDIQIVNVKTEKFEYKKQVLSVGTDSVTKIIGIGGKPKEEKALKKLFEDFLKHLTIRPTAIP